ncbi:MAG: HEAT repeat domain-containing protein [Oscillospiraceae bacterium]|nr:HEAT repeat domain-containing protein [Oscillospiraceae bacterium]
MDITPIYDLKSRLRAAAVAGTSLLSEDFRLKKAAEGFEPLAKSSPVFAKISEMTGKLLSEPSPEGLIDTITLVDAVITTLGTTDVPEKLEPIETTGNSAAVVNAPYSLLSPLFDALTTSGSGNYNTFLDIRDNHPELLNDYRVKPALIKGLSASYAELAEEAAKTLSGMGKDMIPLLKKDFDPDSKRKSVNIISIIEDVCGAEENDFYLEQLENAEKDVRQALIYALRHDEANIDRLIELTKTEKGKLKTAALAALVSFDCEKAAAFFEEYAKKKPVEVIKLMHNVSSRWSSELTARLIDELLVDDKGSKVTLSQAADEKKVKLKAKTDIYELHRALWGKWGADIEKIYREFDYNIPYEPLSTWLGYSIMLTRDESLMALAIELNNKSKLRGHYDFAETIARLLGTEDCTAWLKRKTHELNQKSAGDPHKLYTSDFAGVMEKVRHINGGYELRISYHDEISGKEIYFSAPINQPMKELLDIYIYENHYVREFIKNPDMTVLSVIFKSGIQNVRELSDAFFGQNETFAPFAVRSFFGMLPGDRAFKLNEARRIAELSRGGKLKAKIDADDLFSWVETGMK